MKLWVRVAIAAVFVGGLAACSSRHEPRAAPPHPRRANSAIARAKATDRHLFSIFADTPATRSCGIPEGGPMLKRLRGTCTSSVRAVPGYSGFTVVTFTEAWPGRCRSAAAHNAACRFHAWAITEDATGNPVATRNLGDIAPQNYF
jgi:hypothetical protein